MRVESLAEALERDHSEIDEGIQAFNAGPRADGADRAALTRAAQALRRHIYLEEKFLFPPLRTAGLAAPVLVMLREHVQIWATLDLLQRELDSGDPRQAQTLGRQLAIQLQHHNVKEERVLYPQADVVLAPAEVERLRTFLEVGELPEGWTCAKADDTPR